jgi:hypothetical protein
MKTYDEAVEECAKTIEELISRYGIVAVAMMSILSSLLAWIYEKTDRRPSEVWHEAIERRKAEEKAAQEQAAIPPFDITKVQ